MIEEQEIIEEQVPIDQDPAYKRLFEFNAAKVVINDLIGKWDRITARTLEERTNRMIDLDPEELEKMGQLASDETIINWRLIDTNIKREQPDYVAFLTQSKRLVTLDCQDKAVAFEKITQLEDEFSKGMKYSGWQVPFIMAIDGHQCHGWDAVEVVLDTSKPFHLRVDHIGQDNLIFPLGAQSLESCEHLLIKITVSQMELKSYVRDYGFDEVQVNRIVDKQRNNTDDVICIYKRYFKADGIVYVCWFEDQFTDSWLKAPEMFVSGMKQQVTEIEEVPQMNMSSGIPMMQIVPTEKVVIEDQPSMLYPVFLLRYGLTEVKQLVESKGRAFIDNSKQEASCSLWSATVNAAMRGSCVYGSVDGNAMDGSSRPTILEDIDLRPNQIYDRAIKFWSPPGPNAVTISAAEKIDNKNSQEAGQPDFATMNREDSRKTKQELVMSQAEGDKISSVNITTFSLWISQIGEYCFEVVKSRGIAGLVRLLVVQEQETPEGPLFVNDIETLSKKYIVKAAGDVDYIGRKQKLATMKGNWPVIQATPLAMTYLIDMLKIDHPEDAERYAKIIMEGDQKKQLIMEMATILGNMAKADGANMDASQQQLMQNLQQRVQNVMSQP